MRMNQVRHLLGLLVQKFGCPHSLNAYMYKVAQATRRPLGNSLDVIEFLQNTKNQLKFIFDMLLFKYFLRLKLFMSV